MIPTTALALNYISLVERKEGIGLAQKVNLLPPVKQAEWNEFLADAIEPDAGDIVDGVSNRTLNDEESDSVLN